MKNTTLFSTAVLTACGLAASPSVSALELFSTSFTTADGFVDGDINFAGANPDTVVGQASFSVTDSAGVGLLNSTGTAFTRALFGRTAIGTQADFLAQAAGDSYVVEYDNLTISGAGGGTNVGVFGLVNENVANILGGSNLGIGIQLVESGTNLFIDTNPNFTPTAVVDTGVDVGETFDLSITFLADGLGAFDVITSINGSTVNTIVGVTPTFDQGTPGDQGATLLSGYVQDFGGAGAYSVDALTISSFEATVIPEPASLALLALGGLTLVGRRRRA